jgi:hypothetical protein
VPALEPVAGVRVVALPEAIDGAAWEPRAGTAVWRTAPDEAFAWQRDALVTVTLDDPDAITEPESGFVAADLSAADLAVVDHHVDVPLPSEAALVQGKVAGVPARLGLRGNGTGILLVQAAHARELAERLGWLE